MVKWGQNCFFGKNSLCKVRVIFLGELLLEKTVFRVRQKGVPPLLLPTSGLLAHTSAAFLKNCCTEKLFICASHKPFTLLFPNRYAIMKQISERSICLCIAYSNPSLP